MPEHSGFHASFIKTLIPKPSIKLLTLVKSQHMKLCQVLFFFSLGNHALHQKICCHKKTKLFLRALFWGFEIVAPAWNLIFPQMLIPGKGKQAWRLVHCALRRAPVPKPFPHSPSQGLLRCGKATESQTQRMMIMQPSVVWWGFGGSFVFFLHRCVLSCISQ